MNYGYNLLRMEKLFVDNDLADLQAAGNELFGDWIDTRTIAPEGILKSVIMEAELAWSGAADVAGTADVTFGCVYAFNIQDTPADAFGDSRYMITWTPGNPTVTSSPYTIDLLTDASEAAGVSSIYTAYVIGAAVAPRWLMPMPRYIAPYLVNNGNAWDAGTYTLYGKLFG